MHVKDFAYVKNIHVCILKNLKIMQVKKEYLRCIINDQGLVFVVYHRCVLGDHSTCKIDLTLVRSEFP